MCWGKVKGGDMLPQAPGHLVQRLFSGLMVLFCTIVLEPKLKVSHLGEKPFP